MSKKLKSKQKLPIMKLVGIGILVVIVIGGYYAYQSLIPVNVDYPVFLVPENILIKTATAADGHSVFSMQSSKGGKQVIHNAMTSPTITITTGNLVDLHIINEIKNTHETKSVHNFNIDEFNVHSKNLGYFDSQSIKFLADKSGQYTYHCTLHPEMKGLLIIK
ncbi:MAG: cupredoxin domain-containing protein [Nitrosarchaeum sp.]